jgi:hypothetical protein
MANYGFPFPILYQEEINVSPTIGNCELNWIYDSSRTFPLINADQHNITPNQTPSSPIAIEDDPNDDDLLTQAELNGTLKIDLPKSQHTNSQSTPNLPPPQLPLSTVNQNQQILSNQSNQTKKNAPAVNTNSGKPSRHNGKAK